MFNVLSIMAEVELYKEMLKVAGRQYMYRSEVLGETSNFRKLGAFAIRMPKLTPYWNRSMFLEASAMTVRDSDSILIIMKSLKGDTWINGQKVERDPDCCEVDFEYCCIHISQLEENR